MASVHYMEEEIGGYQDENEDAAHAFHGLKIKIFISYFRKLMVFLIPESAYRPFAIKCSRVAWSCMTISFLCACR